MLVPVFVLLVVAAVRLPRGPAPGSAEPPPGEILRRLATRPVEARLGELPVDRAIPFRPSVPGDVTPELAAMTRSHDPRTAALGLILGGEAREAGRRLATLPEDDGLLVDRAAAALVDRQPAEAVALLGRLPEEAARRPAAAWNRALALRDLGLPAAAADELGAVVAAGEPGWRDEARDRERALRAEVASRHARWTAARTDGEAMIVGGPPVAAEVARAFPGIIRLFFNDALRGAATRARITELQPLAAILDERYGGSVLQGAVRRALAADEATRAPLAAAYRKLVAREQLGAAVPPADLDVPALLAGARAAALDELLLGAWVLTDAVADHQDEFTRRAAATGDPWLVLQGLQLDGQRHMDRGELVDAERPLLTGLRACRERPIDYRCAYIEFHLSRLNLRLLRPVESQRFAREGLARARALGEWGLEAMFLQQTALIERVLSERPLARAFLAELRARGREIITPRERRSFCGVDQYVTIQLASLALDELRPEAAYDLLRRTPLCDRPIDVWAAEEWSHLTGWNPAWVDEPWLLGQLEANRRAERSGGQRALADVATGRILAWRDLGAALPYLRRAIETADSEPAWDIDSKAARARAFEVMAFGAARQGRWDEALEALAREAGVETEGPCRLALALDRADVLVAWRGPAGGAGGQVVRGAAGPLGAGSPVGKEPLAALRDCPAVDVLARPPFQGTASLFPPEVAWRFRVGHRRSGARPPDARPHRLVVAVTQPPPGVDLPVLAPLPPPTPTPDAELTFLAGEAATPTRTLAEMERATEIEFYTHGLVDLDVSDASFLVLAPEGDGSYALTAGQLRQRRLEHAPLVKLQSCRAARPAPDRFATWSLPLAFIQAGASAVLASLAPVVDGDSRPFFDTIDRLSRRGAPVAAALRDARVEALQRNPGASVGGVVLFE